jgi:pimeloyl-ACP methyl ester carboxylesterase
VLVSALALPFVFRSGALAVAQQGSAAPSAPASPAGRGAPAPAQFPPMGNDLTSEETSQLQAAVDRLAARVAALKQQYSTGPLTDRVADVEVYLEAVRRPLKYGERLYAGRGSTPAAYALQTINTGLERADALAGGKTPWMSESGVRGFYSRLDGSAQPYILTMPDRYDPSAKGPYRLDIFLHGRDDTTLEQQFMTKSTTGYNSKPLGPGPDRFMLQPFSRYTNANRFAGEVDGLEAIESVAKAYPIDRNRLVMTGFSMGGASAWSYALHYTDRWAAVSAGAGFTETAVFLRRELMRAPQSPIQQVLWHLYDSTDYAVNAFNVPIVAYSGEIDAQKQAADAMAAAMLEEGLTLEHLIGPNTAHMYEPGVRQKLQDRLDGFAAKGRNPAPAEIRFTTWTLRYNSMFWITVDAMGREWERARATAKVDGDHITLTTTNVTALHLHFDRGLAPFAPGTKATLTIDGARVGLPPVTADRSLTAGLVKIGDAWKSGDLPSAGLRKVHGLQGPIDDAFMEPFVIVRPTGTALTPSLGEWEQRQADYAISEWIHFFRGEPRVKKDTEISDTDIAANNLALFGDPSSNAIYRHIAAKLPIQWTHDGVVAGGQKYPATDAPVFVFPNPLNPKKYVVINSGFTFHDQSNNDMQSPKLADWAIVDVSKPGNNYSYLPLFVVEQGFFNEAWQLAGKGHP